MGDHYISRNPHMFEVFCVLTDEYGTRNGPTGEGSHSETIAYEQMAKLKRYHPDAHFYVEWVAPQDWAHAY